jgi:hypothetical protein
MNMCAPAFVYYNFVRALSGTSARAAAGGT